MSALSGIRVLDFSQMMFGPWATQMIADVGAEVIKIEPIGGEWQRRLKVEGRLLHGTSPFFVAMNRNKKFVAVNLKSSKAQEAMYALVRTCDVVVNNFRPGVMKRLGLDYETLKSFNPDIIYCQASGYGTSGPYVDRPGQDLLIQSMSGLVANTGRSVDPPTPVGSPVADAFGSLNLAQAILVALLAKERQGIGQYVGVDLLSSTIGALCQEATAHLNITELEFKRSASGIGRTWLDAPFGVYRVADGFIAVAMASIEVLGDVLGSEELQSMARSDQFADRDEIAVVLQKVLATWKREDALHALLERDVWVAPVYSLQETFADPQVKHLDLVETIDDSEFGELKMIRNPVMYEKTPTEIRSAPRAPGTDTYAVLSELGFSADEIHAMIHPAEA